MYKEGCWDQKKKNHGRWLFTHYTYVVHTYRTMVVAMMMTFSAIFWPLSDCDVPSRNFFKRVKNVRALICRRLRQSIWPPFLQLLWKRFLFILFTIILLLLFYKRKTLQVISIKQHIVFVTMGISLPPLFSNKVVKYFKV